MDIYKANPDFIQFLINIINCRLNNVRQRKFFLIIAIYIYICVIKIKIYVIYLILY